MTLNFSMILIVKILAIEGAVGRFDVQCLPHQTLLELMVGDLESASMFYEENGDFKNIRNWPHTEVDDGMNVREIKWWRTHVLGKL